MRSVPEADDLQRVVNRLRIQALGEGEVEHLRREVAMWEARWFRICTELAGPDEPRPAFDDVEGVVDLIRGLRFRNRMCFRLAELLNALVRQVRRG